MLGKRLRDVKRMTKNGEEMKRAMFSWTILEENWEEKSTKSVLEGMWTAVALH